MSTSLAALRQIFVPNRNLNTENSLEHRPEGQFEGATKASFKIQLCANEPQKTEFFLHLELKPGLVYIKYQSLENAGRYPELYLEQIY